MGVIGVGSAAAPSAPTAAPFRGAPAAAMRAPSRSTWHVARSTALDAALALAVFLIALAVNLAAIPTTEFHRDEARWIHRARFVAELRDPLGAYWADRELMWGQPPLGSYLMGVGLLAQGRDTTTNELYNFHFSEPWNRRHGAMPDERDLLAARRTNAVVGALVAAGAFLIARRLAGRAAGVAAAAAIVPHPLAIYLGSLAGSDALLTLTIAAAALLAMRLAAAPGWPTAVALGVACGLGASTKLSPLLIAAPLAGLGGLLLLWARSRWAAGEGREHAAALGWRLLPVPAVAFATFVASYPYLWPDPIGRTLVLFRFRAKEMANQGAIWSELDVAGPVDALGRIGNWLGDVQSVSGNLLGWAAGLVGLDWHPVGIDLVLGLVGALLLAAASLRDGLASPAALAAAVLGGQVALVVLGMRADFARYLYPVVLAQAVCIGVAAGAAWAWLRGVEASRSRGVEESRSKVGQSASRPVRGPARSS
jgi:4-amino-4-deoxy-L-arabinose transferase-like glycosyltransferase